MRMQQSNAQRSDGQGMQDTHAGEARAPARQPTQVERKRREVVSVGLRSCASIARRSSTWNCTHQLRAQHSTPYVQSAAATHNLAAPSN